MGDEASIPGLPLGPLTQWTPDQLDVLKEFVDAQRSSLNIADVTAVFDAMFQSRVVILDHRFVTQDQLSGAMVSLRTDISSLTTDVGDVKVMLKNAGLDNGGATDLRQFLDHREQRGEFYGYLAYLFRGKRGKALGALLGGLFTIGTGVSAALILRALGIH